MKRFYFLFLSILVSSVMFANDGCFQPLDAAANMILDPECNSPSDGWGSSSVVTEAEGAYCGNSGHVAGNWAGVYQKNTSSALELDAIYRVRAMCWFYNDGGATMIALGGGTPYFEIRYYENEAEQEYEVWKQVEYLAPSLGDGNGNVYIPYGLIDNVEVYKVVDPIILPFTKKVEFSMADGEFAKVLYVQSANLPDGDVIKVTYPAGITGPATLEANTILQGDYVDANNYRYGKDELEIQYDGTTDVTGKIRLESSNNSEVFAEIDVVIYKYSQELLNVYQAFEDEDILGGNYALNEIDTDLDLMTNISGITLTWQSSREDVIATDGKVTLQDLAVTVTLTVTFSKEGDDTLEKTIIVRTLPSEPSPYEIAIWKFDSENISFENGQVVVTSNEGEYTEGVTYKGTIKNEAQIRVIGDEGNRFNVLDLGEGRGYFDMGTEIGKEVYKLDDYSAGAYFFVDVDAANIDGHGNFLWTFANSESIGDTQMGGIFIRPTSVKYEITKTHWGGAQAFQKSDYFQKYPFPEDGRPKFQGEWHHILFVQQGDLATIYIDGDSVTSGTVSLSPMDIARPEFTGMPYNWIGRPCYASDNYMQKTLVYDFRLMSIPLTADDMAILDIENTLAALNLAYEQNPNVPDDVLEAALAALDLGDLNNVESDLTLPGSVDGYDDVTVFWSTSDPLIISEDGTVNKPKLYDATVTLTAHLMRNGRKAEKEFIATVPTDGTPFESTLVVHYDFSQVDGKTVTDIAEKGFQGTMMNDAKIAQLKLEDGTSLNVLDLGNGTGYFDLGYEIGQIMYNEAMDYTLSVYFYIDEDYEELGNAGNFLWTFSNWETEGNGHLVAILGQGQQRIELKGPGVLENVEVRDIDTGNYLPAEKGRWVHFAFVQSVDLVASVYIDGLLVAETDIFNLPPFFLPMDGRIGTMYNWIGRSCYGNDSYLRQTMIYDFRMYTEAFLEDDFQGDVMDVPATLEMLNSATMPSGLIPVRSDNSDFPYHVYAVDGKIMIDNLMERDVVSVYDMFGRKIDFARHATVEAGIYLIKINNYPAVKLMVK
jgi:hypothetical protein